MELPLPAPVSGGPLGDDPVPAELPRVELPMPDDEPLVDDELPAPMSEESCTPKALAVLLSSWPVCWMFCAR